jgi:hypothetical protein
MSEPNIKPPIVPDSQDQWVKVHLDHDRLQLEGASGGKEPVKKKAPRPEVPERLKKLMLALNKRVSQFSSVADIDYMRMVEDGVWRINRHIGRGDIEQAEMLIGTVDDMIVKGTDGSRRIRSLRLRQSELTKELDILRGVSTSEAFKTLEQGLVALRKLINPHQLPQAEKAEGALTLAMGQEMLATEAQRTKLQQLQKRRSDAIDRITDLQQRAVDAEAQEPLIQSLADGKRQLETLADSRDEKALEQAVDGAEVAIAGEWKTALQLLEDAKALSVRQALLPTLEEDLKRLQAQYESQRTQAVPHYLVEIKEIEEKIGQLLLDTAQADTVGIQKAMTDLQLAFDYMVDQTDRVNRDKKRVRKALEGIAKLKQEVREGNLGKKLLEAQAQLPVALKDPKKPAFESCQAWVEEDDDYPSVTEFLRCFAVVDGQVKGSEERDAFDHALERRKLLRNDLNTIKRHATTDQLSDAQDAFDAIADLLDKNDDERLDDVQKSDVDDQLAIVDDLIIKIKDHQKTGLNDAEYKDMKDGGHSVRRHGPDIPDEDLKKRLTTGYSPDGVFSPTKKSTRFINYDEWNKTRTKAFEEVQLKYGVDFGKNLDKRSTLPSPLTFPFDHGRTIGEGFIGSGNGVYKSHPSGNGGGKVFAAFTKLPPLTKTKTTFEWDGKKWVAAQHFPNN